MVYRERHNRKVVRFDSRWACVGVDDEAEWGNSDGRPRQRRGQPRPCCFQKASTYPHRSSPKVDPLVCLVPGNEKKSTLCVTCTYSRSAERTTTHWQRPRRSYRMVEREDSCRCLSHANRLGSHATHIQRTCSSFPLWNAWVLDTRVPSMCQTRY